ncbi:MAG: uroporphyrinogen-III synthase [Niabella sp.]
MSSLVPILSTKILPENLTRIALANSFQIDSVPFIETTSVTNDLLKEQIKILAKEHINAIFTSGIAAKAVADLLPQTAQWDICCIRGQTQKTIRKYFPKSAIIATGRDGETLARQIVELRSIKETVFFCGDRRLDVLPEKLTASGIAVKELIVYETKLKPQKIEKSYRAVLFYSPSGVESFFGVNTIDEKIDLFSIGSTTTKAIQKYCNNKVYTSGKADLASMVELVQQTINNT